MVKRIATITTYQIGVYYSNIWPGSWMYEGSVWRDLSIERAASICQDSDYPASASYRVWNYVWGEDPDD